MKHAKWKLRKGDTVMVIAGRDKGKTGAIISLDKKNDRVFVEKLNIVTKHIKKREGAPGRKEEMEAGIHVSNVMIVDPGTGKPTRIGRKVLDNGQKVRVAKKTGEILDRG
jgi:large subunit ribosomal protein L24